MLCKLMNNAMNIILFDPKEARDNLLPVTYTRPVAEIRIGMCTMRERWQAFIPGEYSWETEDYLSKKFPLRAAALRLFPDLSAAVQPSSSTNLPSGRMRKSSFTSVAANAVTK